VPWYKLILGRIYAIYCLVLFVILLVPAYLLFRLIDWFSGNKPYHFHQAFVVWMDLYLPLIGCAVKRTGLHHFSNRPHIVVLNHSSLLDIPISTPSIPLPNLTLGKSSFASVPLFGFIYKCGSILLDRKDKHSRGQSIILMKEALLQGLQICLYPEGTRNKSKEALLPFKDGAFTLAIDASVPIIIGIIKNTKKVLPIHPVFWAWPHRLEIEFLPAIDSKDKTVSALKEEVREAMLKKISLQHQ
jgi:1-acyl-sn-glycerol-3-phosphate acyltransferase